MFDTRFDTKMDASFQTSYCNAPSILVASDSTSGCMAVENAIACLDARHLATVSLDEAEHRLSQTISVSAVVVHASKADSDTRIGELVHHLDRMVSDGICRAVIIVPPRMIDAVFAHVSSADIEILSEPEPADIVAALAMACANRPLRLNDVSGDASGSRLVQLSEEVGRIARALANLAENAPGKSRLEPPEFALSPPMTVDAASIAGARVRAMIRARRVRDQFFRAELFADPAWDMLLDLMAARYEHKRVSVSSLCIAASVPATTALRWIKGMTEEGLFVRCADQNDGRRIFIELSERTAGAMEAYLDWLKSNAAVMV